MFSVNNKSKQNDVNDVVLVILLLNSNIFQHFSCVSVVDLEQVNISWLKIDVSLI